MFFDFSTTSGAVAPDYNNFVVSSSGPLTETIADAIDESGDPTGISVERFGFWGANNSGVGSSATVAAGDAAAIFHPDALQDGAYGHDNWGSRTPQPIGRLTFTGLDPSGQTVYDFTMFNSRIWTDATYRDRTTLFAADGANSGTAELDAYNNISEVTHVTGIVPNALGEITLTMTKTAGNASPEGFYTLNALRVVGHNIPEPTSFALIGLATFGLLAMRRR